MNEQDLKRLEDPFPARSEIRSEADLRHRRLMLSRVVAGVVGMQLSLPISALGIGEPRHLSRLFEPLRVDIPIDSDVDDSELHVKLVVAADGENVPDSPKLTQELIDDGAGRRILRITTRTAIREPVLTLHVDMSGRGTQVRRDLTLLFDPPAADAPSATLLARDDTDARDTATIVGAPVAARPGIAAAARAESGPRARTGHANREPRDSQTAALEKPRIASAATLSYRTPAGWRVTYPVKPGETIEQIAQRVRPSDETPVATMAALLRWNNPRAFNMHTGALLSGVQLRFPGNADIRTQLASFGPAVSSSTRLAFAEPAAVTSPAPAAKPGGNAATPVTIDDASVSSSSLASSSGLQFSGTLSAASMQILASLQHGPLPIASADSLPAGAATPTPTDPSPKPTPVAPIVAARLEDLANKPSSTVESAAFAGASVLPVPTIFPAWLIALALALGSGMLWALARVLGNTPAPIAPPPRRAFARSSAAAPALIDEWMRHADPAEVIEKKAREPVVLREPIEPVPVAVKVPEPMPPRFDPPPVPAASLSGWDPEHFDLSRVEADEAENVGLGKRVPREHPAEPPSAMSGRRPDAGKS